MANKSTDTLKKNTYKKIRKKLEESLKEERFDHTLGVAKTAQMLAHFHGEDSDKAYLAGLLHDCAKNIPVKDQIKLCQKNNIGLTQAELDNPKLIHAKSGVAVAKTEYDIEDEDILMAICSHTTGRPEMSVLEKIIYIADYIEPGRPARESLDMIRRVAIESLDKAMEIISKECLDYLSSTGTVVDVMTQNTYEYYHDCVNSQK